jgi:hypothetical protein
MSTPAAPPTVTVWLLRYPVELGMSTVEHVEDWVREFKLMALGSEGGTSTSDVPVRLQAMVEMLTRRYGAELSEPDRVRAAAAARGQAEVDLAYTSGHGAEGEAAVRGWQAMLAEVDEYCRAEDLLTLQRTPEQVRLQNWVCEEFLRQLHGEPPRPWTQRSAVAPVPRDG